MFSVLFTPSVCWRAAELDWSIPLEILIFRHNPSERTNQVLPLASKQKVKLQFFFMDHVFHDFALSHYIQEILILQWFPIFENESIIIKFSKFVYKNFVLENCFLTISTIKEFIFKNWKRLSCREYFHQKNML